MTAKKTVAIETDEYGYPKVATIEVRTVTYPVYFGEGQFRVYVTAEGDNYPLAVTGDSISALKTKMTTHTNKSKPLNVPFWKLRVGYGDIGYRDEKVWHAPTWDRWLIRGIHASTGNVISKPEAKDGRASQEQYSHSKTNTFRGDMPSEVRDEIARLYIEERKINERRAKLVEQWGIVIREVAKEAMDMEHGS